MELEEDKIALSPRGRAQNIVISRATKSFEDLLEETVSMNKKRKKKKKKKKQMPLASPSTLITEQENELVLEQLGRRAEEGVVNLGADLEDDEAKGTPLRKLFPSSSSSRVLAPIKPTRRLPRIPAASQQDGVAEEQHKGKQDVTDELSGKLSPRDHEAQPTLDPTILNSHQVDGTSVKSPAHSSNSAEKIWRQSPSKFAEMRNSSSGPSVSSSPSSIKSPNNAAKTPEQPKRRRRKLKEQQHEPATIEMTPVSPSRREVHRHTYLNVSIHLCEIPLSTMPAAGIFIRVHVVDVETGCELKTNQEQIVPAASTGLISKFRGKLASVDEDLMFHVPLRLALENNSVLFLELFVPKLNSYSSCYARIDLQERCIGWAFLKLRASTGEYNTDSKLRLQIYEPLGLPKFSPSQSFKTVFGWWSKGPWKKTRCSVFVTVGGVDARTTSGHENGSNNNGSRKSSKSVANNAGGVDGRPQSGNMDVQRGSRTSINKDFEAALVRKDGHLCKVPDKLSKSLPAATFNCLSAEFSPTGAFLAAAANQAIHIFQAAEFGLKCCLEGHEGLVYCVSWLHDDKWLVSSSADCLAIVWDVQSETIAKMLPHPSFVYCAKFVPGEKNAIVTGSKDKTLRVWSCISQQEETDDSEYDLWQELDGHQGFVTSICFDCNKTLYSSDSEGHVISWTTRDGREWTLQREFLVADLRGISVSSVQAHPSGKRIFISARDSVVRMIDVLTGVVLQNFLGALSHKIQTGLCLSPCGSLLMAGSEDGSMVVWQADTGNVLTIVSGGEFPPATAMCYHPHAHLLAVGYFGQNPVNIWIPGGISIVGQNGGVEAQRHHLLQPSQLNVDHLRLQDIIARIDRVLLTGAADEK